MSMGNGRERNHGRVASGRDTVNEQQKMVIKYADANMTVNTPLSWVQIDTVGPKPPLQRFMDLNVNAVKWFVGKIPWFAGNLIWEIGKWLFGFRRQPTRSAE